MNRRNHPPVPLPLDKRIIKFQRQKKASKTPKPTPLKTTEGKYTSKPGAVGSHLFRDQ